MVYENELVLAVQNCMIDKQLFFNKSAYERILCQTHLFSASLCWAASFCWISSLQYICCERQKVTIGIYVWIGLTHCISARTGQVGLTFKSQTNFFLFLTRFAVFCDIFCIPCIAKLIFHSHPIPTSREAEHYHTDLLTPKIFLTICPLTLFTLR